MDTSTATHSIIERAFELAQSGRCQNVGEVGAKLKQEGYESVEAHLAGPSLRRELRGMCLKANQNKNPQPEPTAV